jgi:hypothetical protein
MPPREPKKVKRNMPVAPKALARASASSAIPEMKKGWLLIIMPTQNCETINERLNQWRDQNIHER